MNFGKLFEGGSTEHENQELAKKEEYAQTRSSKITEKIDEGNIKKAMEIFTNNFFKKGYDQETQILTENHVIPFVKEKIIGDINNRKGDELVKMIDGFHSYLRNGDMEEVVEFIKPDDLKQIPEDTLKSPEIVEKIKSYLVNDCEKHLHPNHYGIFKHMLERFSKLGFVSEEEIIKSPEIKEVARKKLVESIKNGPKEGLIRNIIPEFEKLKKVILELGILDEEEVKQIKDGEK